MWEYKRRWWMKFDGGRKENLQQKKLLQQAKSREFLNEWTTECGRELSEESKRKRLIDIESSCKQQHDERDGMIGGGGGRW
jgi:hypothetical protein